MFPSIHEEVGDESGRGENIKVFVRARPISEKEEKRREEVVLDFPSPNTLQIQENNNNNPANQLSSTISDTNTMSGKKRRKKRNNSGGGRRKIHSFKFNSIFTPSSPQSDIHQTIGHSNQFKQKTERII